MTRITHDPAMHRNIPWKVPVRAATTANITISTALNNGDSLDGVTLATGDRVLVKDQSTGSQNGIYVVSASPVRADDFVLQGDVLSMVVFVSEGTANADTAWLCTTNAPIVVGTTTLVFTAFGTGGGSLRVKEIDGTPNVFPVNTIQVTNGALTDNGGGDVSLAIGSGAQQFTEDTPRYRFLGTFSRLSQAVSGATDAFLKLVSGQVQIVSDNGSGDQGEFSIVNGAVFLFAFDGTNFVQLDMIAPTGFVFSLDAGVFEFLGGDGVIVPRLTSDPAAGTDGQVFYDTAADKFRGRVNGAWTDLAGTGLTGSPQTYTESNVTTDRTYNANSTTVDELADVLGTLIGDLRNRGIVN